MKEVEQSCRIKQFTPVKENIQHIDKSLLGNLQEGLVALSLESTIVKKNSLSND